MNMSEATRIRIQELIDERGTNVSDLSLKSNLTPSVLYDFMKGKTKTLNSFTLKKICYGAGITLKEFYDREYFNNFDDVVK